MSDEPKVMPARFTDIQNGLVELNDKLFPNSKRFDAKDIAFVREMNQLTTEKTMKLLKAPGYYSDDKEHVIFLAGGISSCPDWQKEVESHLKFAFEHKNFLVVNPRRDNFDMADKRATVQQIEWEHKMLERCDTLLFWFPEETLCPITLYELGNYTDKKKNLIVGVHDRYKRRVDVEKQTQLRRPDVKVAVGFDAFLAEVAKHLRTL